MHRVYARLLDPREHPDDARRRVQPPSWDTFDNQTQFATLRSFEIEEGRIVNFAEALDTYTVRYDLGQVVWPFFTSLFAGNFPEVAEELARRGLYLFDVWGYVPGVLAGEHSCSQFKVPEGLPHVLEATLGDRWLGTDVGEQDGRYVGRYAPQMAAISSDRFEQYATFQRHFERMCDDLGNRVATLVTLNFGHYLLKEGVYTLIGAETAQALPNGQVYYAFIRGAGKQYGVPWFGCASVWNRWGWKAYGEAGTSGSAHQPGPTKGTSLNLLKRLLYHHILYNCVIAGFERSWFDGEGLSPVGQIQQAGQRWVRDNGSPGVMITPVAIMSDFLAGWSFPRHLYTDHVYRVWGNLPYGPGDHLTDGVLDMLYPGYQDSSYFHDETGFITATPYGDGVDCLLSDAEGWLLSRYPVLIVATELTPGAEIRDKLEAYVEAGGHLVITAGNVAKFEEGLAGVTVTGAPRRPRENLEEDAPETDPGRLYPLGLPGSARVISACGDMPTVVEVPLGEGRVTLFASPFGVPAEARGAALCNDVDRPLPKPYPLLAHVRHALDQILQEQMLFEAGEGLSLVTCRKAPGAYTLGIANNALAPKSFEIVSHCGAIQSVDELILDQSEKGAVGYLPEGFEEAPIGTSGDGVIAGGDMRVFSVRVRETRVQEIPHAPPAPRPAGRVLPLRDARPVKEQILARPTFFEHFDGIMVDWRYLHCRDEKTLVRESGWISRQGLRIYPDLTSGINVFPDLRLVNNDPEEYDASMAMMNEILEKAALLGASDLIVSLHPVPEVNFTREEAWGWFEQTLRLVCRGAAARGITIHLRLSTKEDANAAEVVALADRVGAANLRIAPSMGLLIHTKTTPQQAAGLLADRVGLWMVSAPGYDEAGQLWTLNGVAAGHEEEFAPYIAHAADAPLVLDAVYADSDAEYRDARALARMAAGARRKTGA